MFDLDFTIQDARSAARYAKLAYASEEEGKRHALASAQEHRFISVGSTQVHVFWRGPRVLVAFRGTEQDRLEDWITDANIRLVDHSIGGHAHAGFYGGLRNVDDQLLLLIEDLQDLSPLHPLEVSVVGHSLGGALAALFAAEVRTFDKLPVDVLRAVYTFGSPRPGDDDFAWHYDSIGCEAITYRVVNNNDVVSRVPFRSLGYSHVGRYFYLNDAGSWVREDPSSWLQWLEAARGRINHALKLGTDGIDDHKMDDGEGWGYLPALLRARLQ